MALFVKGVLSDGRPTLVNVNHIVNVFISRSDIVYTPVYGHEAGGYDLCLIHCTEKTVAQVFEDLLSFIYSREFGVYDAKAAIERISKSNA